MIPDNLLIIVQENLLVPIIYNRLTPMGCRWDSAPPGLLGQARPWGFRETPGLQSDGTGWAKPLLGLRTLLR
jgi:hypothetical protein